VELVRAAGIQIPSPIWGELPFVYLLHLAAVKKLSIANLKELYNQLKQKQKNATLVDLWNDILK
jgi:hypothetical protein